jgi:hypothetical protein
MCSPVSGREGSYSRYGTILRIQNMSILPDGRALVSCIGVCAFEVLEQAMHDDYHIARVARISDVKVDPKAPPTSAWRAWWSECSRCLSAFVRKIGGQASEVPNGTGSTRSALVTDASRAGAGGEESGGNNLDEMGGRREASQEEDQVCKQGEARVQQQPEEVRALMARLRDELKIIKACQGGRIWCSFTLFLTLALALDAHALWSWGRGRSCISVYSFVSHSQRL